MFKLEYPSRISFLRAAFNMASFGICVRGNLSPSLKMYLYKSVYVSIYFHYIPSFGFVNPYGPYIVYAKRGLRTLLSATVLF